MNKLDIVLIGPMGVGKSTIGKLLASHLKLPQKSMDEYRWDYYKEIGYDQAYARELDQTEGGLSVYRYWKQFEIHAVERLLEEHNNCVIDFGAGHSVYEDDAYLQRAKAALKPFQYVILLLPSPDKALCIKHLNGDEIDEDAELNRHFIEHKSNYELATHIVYTEGATPDETLAEVLKVIAVSLN
ncbi:shikimate kinase [Marinomonas sp. PE14-40]|uniref:shikimate kinase n=1 Tax=Marinomonas sp. PE14-40 TaxID=3060621 RepID=UPI003F66C772